MAFQQPRGGRRGGRGGRGGGGRGRRQNQGRGPHQWHSEQNVAQMTDEELPIRRPRQSKIGYNKLKLLSEDDADDILMSLNKNKEEFMKLLAPPMKPDWVYLVLKILRKGCGCTMSQQTLLHVLTMVQDTEFIDKVIPSQFREMTMIKSAHQQEQLVEPIKDALFLCEQLLLRIPSNAYEKVFLCQPVMEMSIRMLRAKTSVIDQEIGDKVADLQKLMDECAEKTMSQSASTTLLYSRSEAAAKRDEEQPPDDFRQIPVAPQRSDLLLKHKEEPFLRRNKARGGYLSVDHYLDVQFRLLREDFVHPLREGLKEYQRYFVSMEDKRARLQNVRVYTGVHIIKPVCTNHGLTYRIRLDRTRLKNVKWRISKRLIFGSLVCLSRDNFETLLFATVSERKPKDLDEFGELEVKFEDFYQDIAKSVGNMEHTYTMLETTAYFEAYRHILKGLQLTNEDNMPFKRYIVSCEAEVYAPQYLGRHSIYDLRPVISGAVQHRMATPAGHADEEDSHYEFTAEAQFARRIPILHERSWPSAAQLGVDESQLDALKTCLTREFAIIQGPPGTGKTFIGLKVMEVLLHNKDAWTTDPVTQQKDDRPILIVCYTNHALDQFLEGVHKFCSQGILRVGGRSSSEVLEKFNLRNVRAKVKEKKEIPRAIHDGLRAAHEDMKRLQYELERNVKESEVVERGIIHEVQMRNYMSEPHYRSLMGVVETGADISQVCMMAEWLGYGRSALSNYIEPEGPEEMDGDYDDDEEEAMDVEGDIDFTEQQRMLDDDADDFHSSRDNLYMYDVNLLGLEVAQIESKENGGWTKKEDIRKVKANLLRELKSSDAMREEEVNDVRNLWQLDPRRRWRLYRYWISKYLAEVNTNIEYKQQLYSEAAARMNEARNREDCAIMQTATVIGMTTTGAAKYRDALQNIKPKIIIIEEAAEVLESHIITALSEGCEHLILIGDHQQLRPSPAVYKLAINYGLEISLFERMVNNGLHYGHLQYQHRMRPGISGLIKLIYPNLKDDESVLRYEETKGVTTNMFFLSHHEKEKEDLDSRSHSNRHEAEYIAGLCKYLLLQGYSPQQITVLTPYTGQLFALRDPKVMDKKTFDGVRITVVDNYQGEENDIILLSLVRSNVERKLGFLKILNRICVALSRAKKAMYVIGNFDMMAKESEHWSTMINYLQRNKMIGTELLLQCQNHPREILHTKKAVDFNAAPEGGCSQPCEFRLKCGHGCVLACHIKDREHQQIKCHKPCEKRCPNNHKCRKKCFAECGQCMELVVKQIERCGHSQSMPCHQDPDDVSTVCKNPCEFKLLCGHQCAEKCGMVHTSKCEVKVQKAWPCGCVAKTRCWVNPSSIPCPKKCAFMLKCDHVCPGTCGQCLQGRIHAPCTQPCGRTLVCGHNCKFPCTKECPPCEQPCENRCLHSKCSSKCGDPCTPCNEPCAWKCPHHKCAKVCHELCDRERCDRPCPKRLRKCGHPCIGLCGERCPKLCRICDKEKVTEIFFGSEDEDDARFIQLDDCSHIVEVEGMDQWMAMREEADEHNPGRVSIQMKCCPRCKVPIRKHLRYGNIIKQTLKDIEIVKHQFVGSMDVIKRRRRDLMIALQGINFTSENARSYLVELGKGNVTLTTLDLIENTIEFLRHIERTRKEVQIHLKGKQLGQRIEKGSDEIESRLLKLQLRISEQQLGDFKMEVDRLTRVTTLSVYLQKIVEHSLESRMPAAVVKSLRQVLCDLVDGKPYSIEKEAEASRVLELVKESMPKGGLGITEDERVMIVKAVGLSQGHWYKCPNGHVYAIGECGGATHESVCPECKARIGGTGHRLLGDNRHAGEMDGSSYAAWSQQANMANYGNLL